jgi:hypothetical protein
MTDSTLWLARLTTAVGHLAAEPAAQVAYLASIGTAGLADELALEFEDAYNVLRPGLPQLNVPESAVEKLSRLEALLDEMSAGHQAELWTPGALQTSGYWSEVRRLATDVGHDLDGVAKG